MGEMSDGGAYEDLYCTNQPISDAGRAFCAGVILQKNKDTEHEAQPPADEGDRKP